MDVFNVIWFENLLALHGSNTQVWDLNLLVQDPREAATVLLNLGYVETPTDSKFEDDPDFAERGIRMAPFPICDGVRFALYLGCLIYYCYYLKDANGEVVKDPAYAKKLKPEHREVHYDFVADSAQQENFTTTSRHQYHARRSREITEGTFTPQPYQKAAFRLPLTTLPE